MDKRKIGVIICTAAVISILFIIGPMDYLSNFSLGGYKCEAISYDEAASALKDCVRLENGDFDMQFSPAKNFLIGFEINLINQPDNNTGTLLLTILDKDSKILDKIQVDLSEVEATVWYKAPVQASLKKGETYTLRFSASDCATTPYLIITDPDYLGSENVSGDVLLRYAYEAEAFPSHEKLLIGLLLIAVWGLICSKLLGFDSKYCYMLMAVICCYATLRPLSISEQVSESMRILCYILCLYSIYKSDTVSDALNKAFDRPWKKALQILLEIYGTFAMTGVYLLHTNIAYEVYFAPKIYCIASFIWVCPIMKYFMAFLIRLGDSLNLSEHEAKLSTRFILMGIMMIPCMLFLIAFNPAITSPDSETCFDMAHKLWQPGIGFRDWHPPFYILTLNLLLKIWDSISFLIVLQYICFAAVFVDGILFLYQCGFSKKKLGLFYIFITFGVNNIIQLTTLWKDIPYTISLMWLTLLLMKLVMRHDVYQNKRSWYVQFIIAIIFTGFFRQNGILPALAVIIMLPAVTKFSKKIIASCIICVLLILAIKGPLYKAMNIVPSPQLKFISLANDIMFSYYTGSSVSEEAMEMINKITGNDPDNWTYNPYYVIYNANEPSGYSVAEFLKIYFKNIIQNPRDMVMAVAVRNSIIWSIARPHDERAGNVNRLTDYHTYSPSAYAKTQAYEIGMVFSDGYAYLPHVYPERKNNGLTEALTVLCDWIRENTVLYLFMWRNAIYNMMLFVMSFIAFCTQKKQKLLHMMPYVPVLVNLAALFIASGWTNYRYFWFSMLISLFLLFFFMYERRMQSADE